MLSQRAKSPLLAAQRRFEPTTLHYGKKRMENKDFKTDMRIRLYLVFEMRLLSDSKPLHLIFSFL